MRRSAAVVLSVATAAALPVALAQPAAAAKPSHRVVDVSSATWEARTAEMLSAACGFPIAVTGAGHVRETEFARDGGLVFMAHYATRVVFTGNGRSVAVRDVGPDRVVVHGETAVLQMIGRSITGSGNIGRTTVDLGTGDSASTGRYVGPWPDTLCLALMPTWKPPPPPPPPQEP